MLEKPAFIQGFFSATAEGLASPVPFGSAARYQVPADKRAQTIYFRAGNPSAELIYLVLVVGGSAKRFFPVGAKGAIHVPLAVVEDIAPDTAVDVLIAAAPGPVSVILDVGFVEID